ncbi:MAG: ATP-dependent RNA helicase, partial [Chitinivibrionales bacterium]|nr:ATP-dependent RNA helicase [Chitinivibrionales bacterium]
MTNQKNSVANSLPIHEKQQEITQALSHGQVLIIEGQTGCGKTTQIPQFCYNAAPCGNGIIGITQPRRIAAIALCRRVASEMGCTVGTLVGYKIRFAQQATSQTKILFMTDGILLNEIQSDRFLRKYQTIIIDEVHERSVNIDFLIGYFKQLLPKRPELKLILSSATIDTSFFSKYFDDAPVIHVPGRTYPVDVWYQKLETEDDEEALEEATYVEASVSAVEMLVESGEPGTILVFMPTERDIIETIRLLEGRNFSHCVALPLFGRLTSTQQDRIFEDLGKRKIIVSTNIAETSLTVPGVRFVIDTGLVRMSRYMPHLRTNRLPIELISQASADQRKGRCGRVSEGICIRLYSEDDFLSRPEFTDPEILRTNLAAV